MCRILAYAGPDTPLEQLVSVPPHSLVEQSYQPREMTAGTVNADGFGLAWYEPDRAEPHTYRHILPIWSDPNLESLGKYVRTGRLLAYVRSATPGQGLDYAKTQPFVHEDIAFVHNGFVDGFSANLGGGLHRALRNELEDWAYGLIRGTTDSEHLFAWITLHVRKVGALTEGAALALARLETIVGDVAVSLNFAIADSSQTIAVRHGLNTECPSLYSLENHPCFPGAVIVASEPLFDDPAWQPCSNRSLIEIEPDSSGHTLRTKRLAA